MVLDHLQRELRGSNTPFTLTSSERLDYGITIPIILLTKQLKEWKLIPLAPSLLDAQAHFDFGRGLKEVLHREETRIAFIASADLSHKLVPESPGGASIEGPAFDATIQTKVKSLDAQGLLSLDLEAIEAAGQCGYRPIMTLMGVLSEMNVTPQVLSYEAPFGVGYLTVTFDFA
jgi:AmmeMemoRadiSam system protein B